MAPSTELHPTKATQELRSLSTSKSNVQSGPSKGDKAMSIGTILVILLIIFLLGGFSGRFGGYVRLRAWWRRHHRSHPYRRCRSHTAWAALI
jgi:hypothetical protein